MIKRGTHNIHVLTESISKNVFLSKNILTQWLYVVDSRKGGKGVFKVQHLENS